MWRNQAFYGRGFRADGGGVGGGSARLEAHEGAAVSSPRAKAEERAGVCDASRGWSGFSTWLGGRGWRDGSGREALFLPGIMRASYRTCRGGPSEAATPRCARSGFEARAPEIDERAAPRRSDVPDLAFYLALHLGSARHPALPSAVLLIRRSFSTAAALPLPYAHTPLWRTASRRIADTAIPIVACRSGSPSPSGTASSSLLACRSACAA